MYIGLIRVGHCTTLIRFKSVKAFICLVTTKCQTVQHIPQKEAVQFYESASVAALPTAWPGYSTGFHS